MMRATTSDDEMKLEGKKRAPHPCAYPGDGLLQGALLEKPTNTIF